MGSNNGSAHPQGLPLIDFLTLGTVPVGDLAIWLEVGFSKAIKLIPFAFIVIMQSNIVLEGSSILSAKARCCYMFAFQSNRWYPQQPSSSLWRKVTGDVLNIEALLQLPITSTHFLWTPQDLNK